MNDTGNNDPTPFMQYWEAVDAAMLKHFGIDTSEAGIDAALIAGAQEQAQTPEDFARWYGDKYDLTYLDEWRYHKRAVVSSDALIAAAPELLQALKALHQLVTHETDLAFHAANVYARLVLAKAKEGAK